MNSGNPVVYSMSGSSTEVRVSLPLVYVDDGTISDILSEKVTEVNIEEAWVSSHLTVYGRFPSVVVLRHEYTSIMGLVKVGSVTNHGNAVWSFTVSIIPAYHIT